MDPMTTCLQLLLIVLIAKVSAQGLWNKLKDESLGRLTDPTDGVNYILPEDTYSVRYDISLTTDFHEGVDEFTGRVVVSVLAPQNATEITMHCRNLSVHLVNLYNNTGGELIETNLAFTIRDEVDFLVITPTDFLPFEKIYLVEIFYSGILSATQEGFHRISYINDFGAATSIAATNFKTTDARRAFPW